MKANERKNLKIDPSLFRDMMREKAETDKDLYVLAAEAWLCYVFAKTGGAAPVPIELSEALISAAAERNLSLEEAIRAAITAWLSPTVYIQKDDCDSGQIGVIFPSILSKVREIQQSAGAALELAGQIGAITIVEPGADVAAEPNVTEDGPLPEGFTAEEAGQRLTVLLEEADRILRENPEIAKALPGNRNPRQRKQRYGN